MIKQWDGQPITEAGIYTMPKEAYHADPCAEPSLSRSCIEVLINKSPKHAHAFHPRLGNMLEEKEESEGMLVGTVVDELLLGGQRNIAVSPYDDYRKGEAREWRDACYARGAIPIKEPLYAKCNTIVKSFADNLNRKNFPGLAEDFPTTNFQHIFVWKENGVWNRAMLDTYGHYIWDLKTTKADAAPAEWTRKQLFGAALELQAAYYLKAHHKVTGEKPKDFLFAVIEQVAPFDCYPVQVDHVDLIRAEEQIEYAQRVWRQCLDSGVWPGYSNKIIHASSPAYVQAGWEEQKALQKTLEMDKAA